MSPTLQTKYPRLLENVKAKPDGWVSGRKAGIHEIRTVIISSAIILYNSRTHVVQIQRGVRIGRTRRYVHNVKHKVQMIEV